MLLRVDIVVLSEHLHEALELAWESAMVDLVLKVVIELGAFKTRLVSTGDESLLEIGHTGSGHAWSHEGGHGTLEHALLLEQLLAKGQHNLVFLVFYLNASFLT